MQGVSLLLSRSVLGISCIYFQLHAALQSQLLTGSQAGMASVRMIRFFSCLSLQSLSWASASISLALLIKAFCVTCCLHWLLVFNSEVLVFPSYSQNLLWIHNQKAWSRVIRIKTVNSFMKILSSLLREHPNQQELVCSWFLLCQWVSEMYVCCIFKNRQ